VHDIDLDICEEQHRQQARLRKYYACCQVLPPSELDVDVNLQGSPSQPIALDVRQGSDLTFLVALLSGSMTRRRLMHC
jgi:hypothetical protein